MRVPLYGKVHLCRDCDNAVREAKGGGVGSRILSDEELAVLDSELEGKLAEPIQDHISQPGKMVEATQDHIVGVNKMVIEGRKDDGGKLRYDLLPPDALAELVRVYTVGAARYKPRNWETGISYSRCFAALQRHSWAIWNGEDIDPEDGIPHSAKVAWYGLTLSAFRLRGMGHLDDRPVITRAE